MKKMKHILKAISSGIIWGLGQLFNKQPVKAAMFFILFAGLVTAELCTSSYFSPKKYDIYENLNGKYFGEESGHSTIVNGFLGNYVAEYNLAKEDGEDVVFDAEVESLLISYGALEVSEFEGEKVYEFVGLKAFSIPIDEVIDLLGMKIRRIYDAHILYDEYGRVQHKSYLTAEKNDGENIITYIVQEEIVIDGVTYTVDKYDENSDVLLDIHNQAEIDATLYADENVEKVSVEYLADSWEKVDPQSGLTKKEEHPEAYQKELEKTMATKFTELKSKKYNALYEQYFSELLFQDKFVEFMGRELKEYKNQNRAITADDWGETLIKIYYSAFPEKFEALENRVNSYWAENGGVFARGIWSIATLGKAAKINIYEPNQLSMLLPYTELSLNVHNSVNLLIYGVVIAIALVFILIFYVWNIRDAYNTSVNRAIEKEKAREEGRKPIFQTQSEYFKEMYEECFPYIFLLPAVIIMAFITFMPIIFSLLIAFTNYDGDHIPPASSVSWVGLKNFVSLINFSTQGGVPFGDYFWRVLCWTLIWAVGSTFTCFFGGFIQAIIVNNERVIFRKFWRTILILPWAVPALVSQMMFKLFFATDGAMNKFLSDIGVNTFLAKCGFITDDLQAVKSGDFIKQVTFLGQNGTINWTSNFYNPWISRIFIIILNIWLGFPYFMAMMSGIMTSISKDLYEAAEIDGATKFQQFSKITVPLVLYSTAPLLIMSFSSNFNNFGVIYFITGGGTGTSDSSRAFAGTTDILISWIYRLTTDSTLRWYSMASVFSILIFIVVATISTYNFLNTKSFKEEDMM